MGGGASSKQQKYEAAPEAPKAAPEVTTNWETEARKAGWLTPAEVEKMIEQERSSGCGIERESTQREAWGRVTSSAAAKDCSKAGSVVVSDIVEPELTSSPVLTVSSSDFGLMLAADVGGTNSRFMLYRVDLNEPIVLRRSAPGELLFVKKYPNIRFASFADVVQEYFNDVKAENVVEGGVIEPEVACLAVAGVAQQNQCRLTNLDWLIDGPALSQQFNISYVEVINDFVAQGYGVLTLDDTEVLQVAGPPPVPGASICCIGAGTGLGQCFLTASCTGEYQCFPSEGGHQEFAPRGCGSDETQLELLKFLKVKFSGWNRISVERVVSGKGLCNVYEFLAYKHYDKVDKKIHAEFLAAAQDASIIAKNAKESPLCYQTLQIFAGCYGSVAGTMALTIMPFGGLYLTGGVTQRLQGFLTDEGSFMEAYFDKGRVSPFLKDVPLFFVKGDEMGQRGAHLRGVRLLHHHRQHQEALFVKTHSQANVLHLVPPRGSALAGLFDTADLKQRQHALPPVLRSSPR